MLILGGLKRSPIKVVVFDVSLKTDFNGTRNMTSSRVTGLLSLTLLLWTGGCNRTSTVPLPANLLIEITGNDFEWHVRYAGLDETLGTDDDYFTRRDIALVAGVDTTIHLKSRDYLYSFALPHLGLKEIAVPDLEFSLHFAPEETGEFILKGDQLCGYQHPKLLGKVKVLGPSRFAKWRSEIPSDNDSLNMTVE